MNNFKTLLDFTDVKDTPSLNKRLEEISYYLMHHHKLEYQNLHWDITAIEFYLHIPDRGNGFQLIDPFIHMNKHQLNNGTFYVHDDCRRAANYSGIDITCGSEKLGIYGGILIRELNRRDGSATAVKSIVRKHDSIKYLKTDKWNDDEKRVLHEIHQSDIFTGPLKLVPKTCDDNPRLFKGRRILPPKDDNSRSRLELDFFHAKLRYAIWETSRQKRTMEEVILEDLITQKKAG